MIRTRRFCYATRQLFEWACGNGEGVGGKDTRRRHARRRRRRKRPSPSTSLRRNAIGGWWGWCWGWLEWQVAGWIYKTSSHIDRMPRTGAAAPFKTGKHHLLVVHCMSTYTYTHAREICSYILYTSKYAHERVFHPPSTRRVDVDALKTLFCDWTHVNRRMYGKFRNYGERYQHKARVIISCDVRRHFKAVTDPNEF